MTGLEIVVLEIFLNSKERWLYVLGYKPPNILCDKLLNESQNIVILGDHDYDSLKENGLSNACVSFDLHNVIKGPTCSMTQRGILLDLCLVTQPERFKKSLNLECRPQSYLCYYYRRNMARNLKNKYPTSVTIKRYKQLRNTCVKLRLK